MGKFTQSVKRIVQEVKEDGTQGKESPAPSVSVVRIYLHLGRVSF